MPIFIFTKERRKKLIKLKDTYEKIFETVWHNSCFQGKKGWYRISQNDEVGKLPHRSVFGERLELII